MMRTPRLRPSLVAILLTAWTLTAAAQRPLTVLYDNGQTWPLAPLYEAAGLDDAAVSGQDEAVPSYGQADIDRMRTTVRSERLTPGKQPRRPTGQAGKMLPRPLFLIGTDTASLAWLRAARPRLVQLGAVGLVVQADGPGDLARLRDAADGLTLALGSGDTLAEQFGIAHYPVLIGPEWIEQ